MEPPPAMSAQAATAKLCATEGGMKVVWIAALYAFSLGLAVETYAASGTAVSDFVWLCVGVVADVAR